MFNVLKYIGDSSKRILTTNDLKTLGATEEELKTLSGNSVLTFVKNVAHDLESGLAKFIASHETLAAEFHLLSDDEAQAEADIHNPISEGADTGSTEPAGTTPAEPTTPTVEAGTGEGGQTAETSPAETSTTESAVSTEPSPATTEVAADTTNQSA